MNDYRIVLVDDDKNMLEVLQENLQDEFKVQAFSDPLKAILHMEDNVPDAIILDFHMPGNNAFDIYRAIRLKQVRQPILFLTGDHSVEIKVQGLELGADDFLRKPISSDELSAHLRNRIKSYKKLNPAYIQVRNLEMNLDSAEVKLNGNLVQLTRKEFQILSMLLTNRNTVIKKTEMIDNVWGSCKVEENNIDTHLSNLRKKIKAFTGQIVTMKCYGYILKD